MVRSDAFAGVERYITYVAPRLALRGCKVLVIGGDPASMAEALDPHGIAYRGAATTGQAAIALLRAGHLDLVHAHMSAAEAAAVVSGLFTRTPLIATRHFAARRGSSLAGRAAAAAVARKIRCEIAISRFVAESIDRPSVVVPHGVPRRAAGRTRKPVVLMAQRLEQEKEVGIGIRGWAASELWRAGWRLVVAGDGAQRRSVEALVPALELPSGCVEFVGRQSSLDALYDEAGIFLATARVDAFGFSVVEAMASGLPIVASAAGGHLETVGSCTTEWMFPPGDYVACGRLLRLLAADEQVRESYGLRLQATQRRMFDLDDHADRLVALYRSLTSPSSRLQ